MQNESYKNYFWLLIDLFLAVAVLGLVFWGLPIADKYKDSLYPTRTMMVSAEGKSFVSPDTATVSFSVVSRGLDPDGLAETNNKKVSDAIDFVKSQGIDAKDIRTTGYNLSPDYAYDENTRRSYITGYTLTQTVSVKIRDLGKVAKVVGGLTPLGVNQIGGVNFGIEDPDKYLSEARQEAFRKAKEKAEAIAAASGVRLGKIVSVSEYQGGPIYPYYAAEKALGMGGGNAPSALPTIEPGSEEVRLNVSITYSLK